MVPGNAVVVLATGGTPVLVVPSGPVPGEGLGVTLRRPPRGLSRPEGCTGPPSAVPRPCPPARAPTGSTGVRGCERSRSGGTGCDGRITTRSRTSWKASSTGVKSGDCETLRVPSSLRLPCPEGTPVSLVCPISQNPPKTPDRPPTPGPPNLILHTRSSVGLPHPRTVDTPSYPGAHGVFPSREPRPPSYRLRGPQIVLPGDRKNSRLQIRKG